MLRSEMYREAAKAVIVSPLINVDVKLNVLKLLLNNEETESCIEKMAERKKEDGKL